jgi:hypothetical protein
MKKELSFLILIVVVLVLSCSKSNNQNCQNCVDSTTVLVDSATVIDTTILDTFTVSVDTTNTK